MERLVTVVNPRRRTPPRNSKGRFMKKSNPRRRRRSSPRRRRRTYRRRRNPATYALTNPRRRRRRTYRRRSNPGGILGRVTNLARDGGLVFGGYWATGQLVSRVPFALGPWGRVGAKLAVAVILPMFAGKLLGRRNADTLALGAAFSAAQEAYANFTLGGGVTDDAAAVEGYAPFRSYSHVLPEPVLSSPASLGASRAGVLSPRF